MYGEFPKENLGLGTLDSVVGQDDLTMFAGTHEVCLGFVITIIHLFCADHTSAMEMVNHLILRMALGNR